MVYVFLSSQFNNQEFWIIAALLGIIAVCYGIHWVYSKYQEAQRAMQHAQQKLEVAKRISQKTELDKSRIEKEIEQLDAQKKLFQIAVEEKKQCRPDLAKIYADAQYDIDVYAAIKLQQKKRPALKAAEEVKQIAAEKRFLIQQNKALRHQLDFFESLFPWLEDFKEVPIPDAIEYVTASSDQEYDSVRKWLSPEEYSRLDPTEKFQLALDRWKGRKKTAWDIGVDFERCVGYKLETQGYKVTYFGVIHGLEDMGRDLIAENGDHFLVIQCKRWAKEKTIHEKHICQLYGSVAVLASQNPKNIYKGIFVTTTTLSETAKLFAKYANIDYWENYHIADYPLIKCNISSSGEKIYHLPCDQQYDHVVVSPEKGEFFATTVAEAEAAGFRRAYRWHSDHS